MKKARKRIRYYQNQYHALKANIQAAECKYCASQERELQELRQRNIELQHHNASLRDEITELKQKLENVKMLETFENGKYTIASYPGHVSEGKVAWYPLFAHARTIPEIFCEQVRIRTSYTWLLCGDLTKLDIRLAVWELCLRGDRFSLSVVSILLRLPLTQATYPAVKSFSAANKFLSIIAPL